MVADMLGAPTRTVCQRAKQAQEIDDAELRLHEHVRKPKLNEEQYEQVRTPLQEEPDIKLIALVQKLELPVNESRLSRTVRDSCC